MARDERGIALVTVLLVAFAVSGIALACAMWILNSGLITRGGERNSILHDIAVAGLEEGRSQINGNPALYPAINFNTLENNVVVTDAAGAAIPGGVRRSLYVGPDGLLGGQYGVFGTLISVVTDNFGNRAVRRLQINQESFAKFAYFTNVEGAIQFANNDQIRGPVHSNDQITIAATGATFFDSLSTSAASINGQANGTFPNFPPRLNAPVIPMPNVAAFAALQVRANNAGFSLAGNNNGDPSEASIRLDFVSIDLNADGDVIDPGEGFVRIYQDNARPWYVTATLSGVAGNDIRRSPNCGSAIALPAIPNTAGRFRTAFDTNPGGARNAQATNLLNSANRRCYPGGDPRLTALNWPNVVAADWALVQGAWTAGGNPGWRPRPVGMGAPVGNAVFNARPDNAFLWPISRDWNPLWEGVIYVAGKVAVSGVANGRVTVATPNNIIIADDFTMAVTPGMPEAADCAMIAGFFAGQDITVSDNTLNSPQQIAGAGAWLLLDDTAQEDIQATLLTMTIFTADNFAAGPNNAQLCGATQSGRGCLNLSGGVIQNTRGGVGLTNGTGYIKRYSYNACASSDPPPYFPTTGRYVRNRIYELDPKGFNVAAWFAANQNN
jgi:hypothetical protein